MNEKGPHTNPVNSGGAYIAALQTQRPKVITKGGLKPKHFNSKHLWQFLSYARISPNKGQITKPVCGLYALGLHT